MWNGTGGIQDRTLYEDSIFAKVLYEDGNMEERESPSLHIDSDIEESMIVNRLLKEDSGRTIDQISMLGQIIQFKWMEKDRTCMTLKYHENSSVYNLLLYFTSKCLLVNTGDPQVHYSFLLR